MGNSGYFTPLLRVISLDLCLDPGPALRCSRMLTPRILIWQWKIHRLKMYFLLEKVNFQPICKICSSNWIISPLNRGENNKCLKTTTILKMYFLLNNGEFPASHVFFFQGCKEWFFAIPPHDCMSRGAWTCPSGCCWRWRCLAIDPYPSPWSKLTSTQYHPWDDGTSIFTYMDGWYLWVFM